MVLYLFGILKEGPSIVACKGEMKRILSCQNNNTGENEIIECEVKVETSDAITTKEEKARNEGETQTTTEMKGRLTGTEKKHIEGYTRIQEINGKLATGFNVPLLGDLLKVEIGGRLEWQQKYEDWVTTMEQVSQQTQTGNRELDCFYKKKKQNRFTKNKNKNKYLKSQKRSYKSS